MVTKWKIKGIDNYRFGEDKNLYRLPCNIGKRYYGFRLIKKQYPNRWRINNKWISKNQMKVYKDNDPIEIYPENEDMPF